MKTKLMLSFFAVVAFISTINAQTSLLFVNVADCDESVYARAIFVDLNGDCEDQFSYSSIVALAYTQSTTFNAPSGKMIMGVQVLDSDGMSPSVLAEIKQCDYEEPVDYSDDCDSSPTLKYLKYDDTSNFDDASVSL